MRVALHSVLRPGQEAAYEQAHAAIAGELMASLRRAGIRDWTIWRSGTDLFHLVDCDDFDAAMARLAEDPVNQRWQQDVALYVDHFVTDADEAQLALRLVWTLTVQLGEMDIVR